MKKTSVYYTLLFLAVAAISGFAASPGALDLSFSNDGRVLNSISVSASGNDILIQPDGKILAFGIVNLGAPGRSFFVARYNVNAALDTTFGTSGVALIEFGDEDSGGDIELQADGKILLGGAVNVTGATDEDLVLARLNQDGTLDTTFDGDGKLSISFSSNFRESFGNIDVTSDGKIVVAGEFESVDCSITRLNANGTFDTSFSSDGKLLLDVGSTNQSCFAASQTDNKVVLTTTVSNIGAMGVARLNANGTLDTTFDTDGIANVNFAFGFSRPSAIALQSNGRIIIAGFSGLFAGSDGSVLARLNTNGSLDTSFDADGKVEIQIDANQSESFSDLVVESNGKINALLTTIGGGIARFNSNGSLDLTFGVNGIFRGRNAGRSGIAIQPDGKLLTVGTENSSLLIARHNATAEPSGTSDFDGDGKGDITVFRPSAGAWFTLRSSDNTFSGVQWGTNGDIPAQSDFDGDGRVDHAVFRPSNGFWFILRSSDGAFQPIAFGTSGDQPAPSDFDSDGKSDVCVFRPSNGTWFRIDSSDNQFVATQFGGNGDIAIK